MRDHCSGANKMNRKIEIAWFMCHPTVINTCIGVLDNFGTFQWAGKSILWNRSSSNYHTIGQ